VGKLRDLVEEHHEEIVRIARANKASDIRIFGSVARAEDGEESDVDFLVDMEKGSSLFDLGGIQYELSLLLGVDVDVVSRGSLKPRDAHILEEAVAL